MQRLLASTRPQHNHVQIHSINKSTATRQLTQFRIIEHTVPCQHTRHYPNGAIPSAPNSLRLSVKQYIPLSPPPTSTSSKTPITLIGAHANGFPKELYEPLWSQLCTSLAKTGHRISSIWIADIATQGASGILNESILGDDPSWWDHARDLLFLINQKQESMPQPLVGVGHSVGGSHLAALSLLHPRLFRALVLIDPVIQMENPSMSFAPASTYRRDLWGSREEAEKAFRKSKFYQRWDGRVLEKWIEFGLRELPTELHPEVSGSGERDGRPVTLTTTKAQEVFQYLRPLYKSDPRTDKDLYADFDPEVLKDNDRFYRPEPREIFTRLPELLPPVRYIFGSQSEFGTAERRRAKLDATGSGIGGSGGVKAGRVSETVLDCGHLVCMEKPEECADATASFVSRELDRWTIQKQQLEDKQRATPRRETIGIDDDWKRNIGPPPERPKKPAS